MLNLTGQTIGRYMVSQELGHGGMASVYLAFDTILKREVAVKFIRRTAFSQEVWVRMLKRFEQEAVALAQLDDEGIVRLYDYGEFEGSPYLVMQYVSGGTLKDRLGEKMPYR